MQQEEKEEEQREQTQTLRPFARTGTTASTVRASSYNALCAYANDATRGMAVLATEKRTRAAIEKNILDMMRDISSSPDLFFSKEEVALLLKLSSKRSMDDGKVDDESSEKEEK